MSRPRTSQKASQFTESVIREMTRLANQHGAVNLSQGFPDFPAPEAIKQAAMASRSGLAPQVTAYWLTSASIAALAASFSSAGAGKSGNPCARLTPRSPW